MIHLVEICGVPGVVHILESSPNLTDFPKFYAERDALQEHSLHLDAPCTMTARRFGVHSTKE